MSGEFGKVIYFDTYARCFSKWIALFKRENNNTNHSNGIKTIKYIVRL